MDSEWKEVENTFEKLFVFKDFKEALAFVNKVGIVAEMLHHHPNITLQNYNQVFISTTTHDAENTVTAKDHELAQSIDNLPH